MNDGKRVLATLIIWAFVTLNMGILVSYMVMMRITSIGVFLAVVFAVLAAAAITTTTVWENGRGSSEKGPRIGKAKRPYEQRQRVERLIQSLEDDEVYELEAMLLDRDAGQRLRSG